MTTKPETVPKNDKAKNLSHVTILNDPIIEARPDIIVIEKKRKVCEIIEIAVPHDYQIARLPDYQIGDKEMQRAEKINIVT